MNWMPWLPICRAWVLPGVVVEMDINVLRGIILIVLFISFLGLWAWAWSRKRKPVFHEASMLPLEEDYGQIPNDEDPADGEASESC